MPGIWATTWQNKQVWSESSLFAKRKPGPLATHWAHISLGGCPGWSESSMGAHSFCWFCHVVAQLYFCPFTFWIWRDIFRCNRARHYFYPHLPNRLSHSYQLDESIFHLRSVWCRFFFFFCYFFFLYISDWNSWKQTVSAASDLGLHCLPMSQKWDARLLWVNMHITAWSFLNS